MIRVIAKTRPLIELFIGSPYLYNKIKTANIKIKSKIS
jgi:hypothetical protein